MNEKHNGRGIFYGVIGVATLVVAIIGATFAYFTATGGNNDVIKGNMATIAFGVEVQKISTIDNSAGGLIPMTNGMVEPAVQYTAGGLNAGGDKVACADGNGNAVCQIYRIKLTNSGSVSGLFDGYVALSGGSGKPADYPTYSKAGAPTTMRWAQVYCTGTGTGTDGAISGGSISETGNLSCSTAFTGDQVKSMVGLDDTPTAFSALGGTNAQHATDNIKSSGVTGTSTLGGNNVTFINTNYIRVSDHKDGEAFTRANDTTSALIYSQNLPAQNVRYLYIAVWLTETNTNQNVGEADAASSADNFFSGKVSFYSAEGNEVTATFNSYTSAITRS